MADSVSGIPPARSLAPGRDGAGPGTLPDVIEVLALSDRQVRDQLFRRVESGSRPLLVSQVRTDRFMRPVPEREPFATLEREFGQRVDQLVVVDSGSVEGMWRDPLGDLADRLYPGDRANAYAAATGYLLLESGQPRAVVKKRDPREDLWFLQEVLHRAGLGVPAPDPARRPGREKSVSGDAPHARAGPNTTSSKTRRAPPRPAAPPAAAERSAWEVLQIPPGSSREEAKKAFRTLVALYHPDKVAHLAPELQQLAERRTRELLAAWAELDARLG